MFRHQGVAKVIHHSSFLLNACVINWWKKFASHNSQSIVGVYLLRTWHTHLPWSPCASAHFFFLLSNAHNKPVGGKAITCLSCCPCGTSPFPHPTSNLIDTINSSLSSSSTYPISMIFPMFTRLSNNLPSTTHWVALRM